MSQASAQRSSRPGFGSLADAAPTRALLGVAALGVVCTLAAASRIKWSITVRPFWRGVGQEVTLPASPLETPLPVDDPLLQSAEPPGWLSATLAILAILIGVVALLGAIWLVRALWRRRPRRAVLVDPEDSAIPAGSRTRNLDVTALRQGATRALDLLDQIREPRDAVIRSWLALEDAARETGAPRRPAMSPTEFASAILTRTTADPAAIARLLTLYHRARFSSHSTASCGTE